MSFETRSGRFLRLFTVEDSQFGVPLKWISVLGTSRNRSCAASTLAVNSMSRASWGAPADAGLQGGVSSVLGLLASAPQAPRRPFVGSGGLGLMLRFRDSRFLRYGATLGGFSDHFRNGAIQVDRCAPDSAGDFVDGTSHSAFQLAGRSAEWGDDLVDDLWVAVDRRQHPVDDLDRSSEAKDDAVACCEVRGANSHQPGPPRRTQRLASWFRDCALSGGSFPRRRRLPRAARSLGLS
jgi:hypothetical protein